MGIGLCQAGGFMFPEITSFTGAAFAGTVDELRQLCAGTGHLRPRQGRRHHRRRPFARNDPVDGFHAVWRGHNPDCAIQEALSFMRDFSRISGWRRNRSVIYTADFAALFDIHAYGSLASSPNRTLLARPVVITHHTPSRKSIHSKFAGSLPKACFVSNAERLIDRSRPRLWIHGHTHDSFDYFVKGMRVVCNPRGHASNGAERDSLVRSEFRIRNRLPIYARNILRNGSQT